jgi:hypothetical protein
MKELDEDSGRILLGDNRRQDGHAEADHVSVCCNWNFNWISLRAYIPGHMYNNFQLA